VTQKPSDLFRLLVESVADYAIFALSPTGHVMTWNEGAQRIKGYRPEEIIGRHFSAFYLLEDIAAGKPDAELVLASTEGRWEDEGWRLRSDGSRFWANVVITALRDPTGRLVGFGKVTRDLTERRAAEEERLRLVTRERAAKAAAAAAHQALRARDEFLSVAGHELRTPITSLRGYVQLARRQLGGANELDRARLTSLLALADGQSHRLASLIEQLLDLSRLEGGHLRLEVRPVDLGRWINEVADRLRAVLPDRELLVRTDDQTVVVDGDALRLEQIVTNLVDNAAKFSPDAGPIELEVGAGPDGMASVATRDHGPGIPREHQERIFERFYQAQGERHYGGMGLGLYLSRQIARLHHGTLTYEDAEGGGARFVLRLPRAPRA
jgi:PAS domain S-box-containing protein